MSLPWKTLASLLLAIWLPLGAGHRAADLGASTHGVRNPSASIAGVPSAPRRGGCAPALPLSPRTIHCLANLVHPSLPALVQRRPFSRWDAGKWSVRLASVANAMVRRGGTNRGESNQAARVTMTAQRNVAPVIGTEQATKTMQTASVAIGVLTSWTWEWR